MAYDDLLPIQFDVDRERALEVLKASMDTNARIGDELALISPVFASITRDERRHAIHGTIDKSLHLMFRAIGADTRKIEFYFEVSLDGKTETIGRYDTDRIVNAKKVRRFESIVRRYVERALDAFLLGTPFLYKARVKEAILKTATRAITRIILSRRITPDNIKTIVTKMEKK